MNTPSKEYVLDRSLATEKTDPRVFSSAAIERFCTIILSARKCGNTDHCPPRPKELRRLLYELLCLAIDELLFVLSSSATNKSVTFHVQDLQDEQALSTFT